MRLPFFAATALFFGGCVSPSAKHDVGLFPYNETVPSEEVRWALQKGLFGRIVIKQYIYRGRIVKEEISKEVPFRPTENPFCKALFDSVSHLVLEKVGKDAKVVVKSPQKIADVITLLRYGCLKTRTYTVLLFYKDSCYGTGGGEAPCLCAVLTIRLFKGNHNLAEIVMNGHYGFSLVSLNGKSLDAHFIFSNPALRKWVGTRFPWLLEE
ncbi:MAG: hypothetical protein DRP82_01420 [Planctomycetota bacterium]|nr:MAG: hypothetical protein DRP82_01420 [Planctomycetota bacterium]